VFLFFYSLKLKKGQDLQNPKKPSVQIKKQTLRVFVFLFPQTCKSKLLTFSEIKKVIHFREPLFG
tara:strand:+ start:90000 stop:90194 length:195 start_codon:yes stop_codon:yes gene_type:complete